VGIVDGRGFDATRDRHETQPVAIVSAALAERFFAGQSPIGQMLRRNGDDTPDLLVIGVASNTSVRLLAEEPRPFVYLATSQRDDVYLSLIARVGSDARAASREILGVARTLAPDLMVIESKTMDDHLATMLLPSRALAALFLVFALLALALAAIGLYGVVSCTVAARVREVGIRVSLGATGGEVVRLLMRGGMVLVLIGAGAGMALALLLSRLLSTLLFRVVAADPLVFSTVPALLLAVTLLATLLPARRVLGLSPTTALRAS
jgi:ABC-type antimicrobial peptide transport system permease subunit